MERYTIIESYEGPRWVTGDDLELQSYQLVQYENGSFGWLEVVVKYKNGTWENPKVKQITPGRAARGIQTTIEIANQWRSI